ncbi:GPP34 family phosphoprotein [Peribacillus simplex]|uniref:GPP34 family phosphoprotein n=1 Tax=Peribacillus simplex TaxID=1478 RepID=UPI0025A11A67|nr:GPP34 family phosphoprotein [Peribacillus simplex]MDM5291946.1 GPP34 family phosphoprotein [Peribacillus simplex]
MRDIVIGEEFITLSEGRKIRFSFIGRKRIIQMYAVGGMFFDLLINNLIAFDEKNKIIVTDESYNSNNEALKQLLILINSKQPMTFKRWMRYLSIPSKNRRGLYTKLLAKSDNSEAAQERIVQRIRAELLEPEQVTVEIITLSLLLKSSKLLNQYFSSYEVKQLENRIKELKQNDHKRWKDIKNINKEIEFMDAIILTSAVVI